MKYLEEAPKTTVWIICTTEQKKIIPTLQSRCTVYELKKVSTKGTDVLVERGLKFLKSDKSPKPLSELLYEKKIQSPRLIYNAVDKYASGADAKEAVKNLVLEYDTKAICKAIDKGDWEGVKKEIKNLSLDELTGVRAGVAGYLAGILENSYSTAKAKEAATAIKLVAEIDKYTITQGPATVAVLFQLTQIFGGSPDMLDIDEDSV